MSAHGAKRRVAAVVAAVGLLAAACGDDGGSGQSIEGAWARSSPMMADAGAVYFTLSSDDAAAIVAVSIDESIAATAELHETVMADMSAMDDADDMAMDEGSDEIAMAEDADHMDGDEMAMDEESGHMDGAMSMQEVASVPIDAGESVSFEPGGLHVMLLELVEPLEMGDEFAITLTLDDGTEIDVDVLVRDEAP